MDVEYRVIEAGSDLHAQQQTLREAVLRRPLGRILTEAERARDSEGQLFAAMRDGAVIGSLILFPQAPGAARLRQMAVAPDLQGRGLGGGLLRFAEDWARAHGMAVIETHARCTARRFYDTNGYAARGGEFDEDGVPHVLMWKAL